MRYVRALKLTEEQVSLLEAEVRDRYPLEACGILFGAVNGKVAVVRKVSVTHNVLESPIMFKIDPGEFLDSLFRAEMDGLSLLGFFHSHPSDPSPSPRDLFYMKLWPDNIWLIISALDYRMAAYQIINGALRKVNVIKESNCVS